MKHGEFIRVCALDEVPAGEARAFNVEGYDIAIFNTGDELYAIENRCPHMGAELAEGEMIDRTVCCHEHGWVIDLETGEVVDQEDSGVATFPVQLRDGAIWVQLA